MAVESISKNRCTVKLANGTKDGVVQTVSVNLGNMSPQGWNAQKALNITELLENCLAKQLHSVEHIQTTILSDE